MTYSHEDVYEADIKASGQKTLVITVPPSSPLATQDFAAPAGPDAGTATADLSEANVPGSNADLKTPAI